MHVGQYINEIVIKSQERDSNFEEESYIILLE